VKELGGWKPTDWSEKLTTNARNIIVASDVHFPKHDGRLLDRMVETAVDENVEQIIWAGDLMDMEEYSKWGVDDHTSSFRRNLNGIGILLKAVADLGLRQIWSLGNHEQRIFRTNPQMNMYTLAQMTGVQELLDGGTLEISDHPTILASVGNWMITHPAQYGSFPLVVADKLAGVHQKNIIAAHEHHFAQGIDATGNFVIINSGGLFEPKYHKYIQHQPTAHRSWVKGFVVLHNGYARLVHGEHLLATDAEALVVDGAAEVA
jgi:hypothetical protein